MRAFTVVTSKIAPLDRPNVDTDAIIPKQYLKSIRRTGFGPFLFDDWRYLDPGTLEVDPATRRPNPEFVLNDPKHAGAQILVARDNFGCGSSREHAVWALDDYGFRAVIAPSYADIFFSNCFKNGVLPVVLKPEEVEAIFQGVAGDADKQFTIDLPAQEVRLPCGKVFKFEINSHHKHNLVNGLDEIGLTLQQADSIKAYEAKRRVEAPWLFN
jgi:3-isopropylmalate/(R)-2-methylmalate dehydratase small subunit